MQILKLKIQNVTDVRDEWVSISSNGLEDSIDVIGGISDGVSKSSTYENSDVLAHSAAESSVKILNELDKMREIICEVKFHKFRFLN